MRRGGKAHNASRACGAVAPGRHEGEGSVIRHARARSGLVRRGVAESAVVAAPRRARAERVATLRARVAASRRVTRAERSRPPACGRRPELRARTRGCLGAPPPPRGPPTPRRRPSPPAGAMRPVHATRPRTETARRARRAMRAGRGPNPGADTGATGGANDAPDPGRHQPTNSRITPTEAGAAQSAGPSTRARSRPLRSITSVVGSPRAPSARVASPRGSSNTGRSRMPRSL